MIDLTQFKLKTKTGMSILGEYEGNEKSGRVVVLSHGFGLQRDGRGLFSDLSNVLKEESVVIKFDYNKILDGKSLLALSLDDQKEKLKAVIGFVKKKFPGSKMNIVAHSMGCQVLGELNPGGMSRAIISSPPIGNSGSDFFNNFNSRFKHVDKYGSDTKIKRSDGSYTYLTKDFTTNLQNNNPYKDYLELNKKTKLFVIIANLDDKIDKTGYKQMVNAKVFNITKINADHGFSGVNRKKWIKLVSNLLK